MFNRKNSNSINKNNKFFIWIFLSIFFGDTIIGGRSVEESKWKSNNNNSNNNASSMMATSIDERSAQCLVCWLNRIDALVRPDNGHTWAVLAGWAWRLDTPTTTTRDRFEAVKAKNSGGDEGGVGREDAIATKIGAIWPGLPAEFDLVFTIPPGESAEQAVASCGKTIFVRPPHYYAYDREYRLWRNSSVIHWDATCYEDIRFVITLHRSTLVLLAKRGYVPDGFKRIRVMIGGQVCDFDSTEFPEKMGIFEMRADIASQYSAQWFALRQLIPIDAKNDRSENRKFLALFDYEIRGSHYCVMTISETANRRSSSSGIVMSACDERPISDAFRCPQKLLQLRDTNWAQILYQNSGLSLRKCTLVMIGASVGVLWLNAMLAAISFRRFTMFYRKNISI